MVTVRGIEIGTGKPKICVPITGRTLEEIFEQAKEIAPLLVEVVEWRVDYTGFAHDKNTILLVLEGLRKQLQNKILLFTFRTQKEGGEQELSDKEYFELNKFAAETKLVDLIDLELFSSDDKIDFYVSEIHKSGCKVIVSNHDFFKTPEESEIVSRLRRMEQAGGDILKIAVMPQSPQDVLTLLSATYKASESLVQPVVTMSMAKLGAVSRITGEVFGSALTFGTVGKASAPGQIPVKQLAKYLELFS
ncbi:MAG TPA: type I 3-dehydroquinate dehydratase [Lachnospiraceae bacterium]|nr:type I 3-dehydroquinate dehydratase [uncultured Lachnoclostridium sp.]HAU88233.1 type I 3-dehydroquinate dehydratase [Lachnospiraceae bacterium]